MRRTGLLIAGWALATALALILGLQGVSAISDSVASHPKASLSSVSVREALDKSASSESSSSDDSSDSSSDSSSSSSADTRGGQPSTSPGGVLPASSSSSGSSGGGGSTSSSSSESESTDSSVSAPPEDRTYQLVGGTVGVRFENGEAHLLWATANDGFTAESSGSSSNVDVRFRSDTHESRLDAYWDNGPQSQIEEKPR